MWYGLNWSLDLYEQFNAGCAARDRVPLSYAIASLMRNTLIKHKHWPSTRRPQPKPGCVTQSSNIANPEEFEMTYREVEMNIIQWGEDRGIVQNATAMSQAIKTLEETTGCWTL